MRVDKRRSGVMLACYLVLLGSVGLWATAVDAPVRSVVFGGLEWLSGRGVEGVRYGHVEALANLCLFLPVGALLAGALTSRRWWWGGMAGLVLSSSIELAQMGISARSPSLRDVFFNTTGALLGAAVVRLATAGGRSRLTVSAT